MDRADHPFSPKQLHGVSYYKDWPTCQSYISHGTHLSAKFAEYTRPSIESHLVTSVAFVALLANCAWYVMFQYRAFCGSFNGVIGISMKWQIMISL